MAKQKTAIEKLRAWLSADPARSISGLAITLRIKQPSVSGWLSGAWRPDEGHRIALERVTGIAAHDWLTPEERERAEQIEASLVVAERARKIAR